MLIKYCLHCLFIYKILIFKQLKINKELFTLFILFIAYIKVLKIKQLRFLTLVLTFFNRKNFIILKSFFTFAIENIKLHL